MTTNKRLVQMVVAMLCAIVYASGVPMATAARQEQLVIALPAHPDMQREEIVLSAEVPSPINPPAGCRFHPRCPVVVEQCATIAPELREVKPQYTVAAICIELLASTLSRSAPWIWLVSVVGMPLPPLRMAVLTRSIATGTAYHLA